MQRLESSCTRWYLSWICLFSLQRVTAVSGTVRQRPGGHCVLLRGQGITLNSIHIFHFLQHSLHPGFSHVLYFSSFMHRVNISKSTPSTAPTIPSKWAREIFPPEWFVIWCEWSGSIKLVDDRATSGTPVSYVLFNLLIFFCLCEWSVSFLDTLMRLVSKFRCDLAIIASAPSPQLSL